MTVDLDDLIDCIPVFAKRDGVLAGMLIRDVRGWCLKIGGKYASCGHFTTRRECMTEAAKYGYTFFTPAKSIKTGKIADETLVKINY